MSTKTEQDINLGCLIKIFDDKATSYKFLFFKGLLNQLKNNEFKSEPIILEDVMIDMISFAWYPSAYFKISLGNRDQIINVINKVQIPKSSKSNFSALRSNIKKQISSIELPDLLRHVPYRLLTSFYIEELRGIDDPKRNRALYEISMNTFDAKKPLYKFIDDTKILVHPKWSEYLKENIALVEAWFSWNWLQYLQKNNY